MTLHSWPLELTQKHINVPHYNLLSLDNRCKAIIIFGLRYYSEYNSCEYITIVPTTKFGLKQMLHRRVPSAAPD